MKASDFDLSLQQSLQDGSRHFGGSGDGTRPRSDQYCLFFKIAVDTDQGTTRYFDDPERPQIGRTENYWPEVRYERICSYHSRTTAE
jgi:hypothetical protein